MKNKLSIITAALLAVSCLPVHAGAYVAFDGIVRSYYNCSNDTYTVEADATRIINILFGQADF